MSNTATPSFVSPGEKAKAKLQKKGITLTQFAKQHGFSYRTVSEVVRGINRGTRDEGHRVAKALGLK